MVTRVSLRMAMSVVGVILVTGAVLAEDPVILDGSSTCLAQSEPDFITVPEQVGKGVICYNEGRYKEAHYWWLTAANNNDKVAKYNLGILYSRGLGINRNEMQATEWFRQSAEQGYPRAQYNLGVRLYRGAGAEQDKGKALDYIFHAARQGLAVAQYNLGVRYLQGIGLQKNIFRSYVWLRAAAKGGHTVAQEKLQTVPWELEQTQLHLGEYLADSIGESGEEG